MRRSMCMLLAMVICLSTAQQVFARSYHVKFGSWPHGPNLLYVQTTNGNYNRYATWGSSYGYTPGYTNGSRVHHRPANRKPIVSIHIKVNNPATDDFLVDSSSGGTVFTRVYIRKVGTRTTEAIFTGASISYDDSLWSLVYGGDPPAGTPTNPYENFRGFWTDATLLPDGDGWTQIAGLNSKSNPKWERMVSACPNKHRDITAYSATKDLDTIVFSTGQECFVFVAATGKLHSLSLDGEVPEINRIVVDEGGSSATFFHDGVQISKGSLSGDKLGEEIGVVPIEKKVSEVTSD